jgi:alkaline phosphatase D
MRVPSTMAARRGRPPREAAGPRRESRSQLPWSRRRLLGSGLALGAAGLAGGMRAATAPAAPALPATVLQLGDVTGDRVVVWARAGTVRADAPARLHVEYAFDAAFTRPVHVRGPHALAIDDGIARVDLAGLPAHRDVHVRAWFTDLATGRAGDAAEGRLRTAAAGRRNIRFLWSGDTAGQGFGINPEFGGMRIYESMRRTAPDFFIHSGDTIYADGPIAPELQTVEGRTWRNVVTPEVAKVAETLDEFRGRYRYNLLDENVRRFAAEVPQVWQWDDHEVVNNWSPGKDLAGDARYADGQVARLVAHGTRAFLDYAPMRPHDAVERERVHRHLACGELLDVFVLDLRSYRAANSHNTQPRPGPDTALLGDAQVTWLKERLRASRATWKVIACDMPIGLRIGDGTDADGRDRFEAVANGDGAVRGREFEVADILAAVHAGGIRNLVWLTADVHYCAAHHYAPERARFAPFTPFWEFVAGPLNAGAFGPATLDDTFGPRVVFHGAPPAQMSSPYSGCQYFGQVDIDARTAAMTVTLKDLDGRAVFTQVLDAAT